MTAVEVRNLSKNYPLSDAGKTRFRRLFAPGKIRFDEGLWALRDVGFSVERGEAFGIIGTNGSGKSTLLRIVAGILQPTSGSVSVGGRLSALLELGSGFSPEFTGRDNVYLNASILGLSRAEIKARFDVIERFAEIGDFIDQPIKTYSTGMVLRLAFAVAAHVDPEILIVDEALAVGDIAFRQRCMRRIHDLRARGATILFVSHETSDVKALCERCLWLHNGVVRGLGEADDVVARYLTATLQREIHAPAVEEAAFPGWRRRVGPSEAFENHRRYGDGRAHDRPVQLGRASRPFCGNVAAAGSYRSPVCFPRKRPDPVGSSPVSLCATRAAKTYSDRIRPGKTIRSRRWRPAMRIPWNFTGRQPELAPGRYYISLAVSDGNIEEFRVCDYVEDAVMVDAGGN